MLAFRDAVTREDFGVGQRKIAASAQAKRASAAEERVRVLEKQLRNIAAHSP